MKLKMVYSAPLEMCFCMVTIARSRPEHTAATPGGGGHMLQ